MIGNPKDIATCPHCGARSFGPTHPLSQTVPEWNLCKVLTSEAVPPGQVVLVTQDPAQKRRPPSVG